MPINPALQEFKPITTLPKSYELGAFDIEGVGGPQGFITGSILVHGNYTEFTHPQDMLEFIRRKEFNGVRFAAHNLTYDFGILEPWLNREDYPLMLNGRPFKVSIARGQKHPRFLVDSLLFAGGLSLAKVGQAINLPKLDTPPSLLPESKEVPQWTCEKHGIQWCVDCYLKRDVEIVYNYMNVFQTTINNLGGELKFTLASTAMDLFRRHFLDDTYKTPFEIRNQYCRNAYYGGRVEPYKIGLWKDINVYDINSLYPFVMHHFPYPNPNTLHGPLDIVNESYIYDKEGISEVTIDVPETYIPTLPYRHNDKLYFPVGTLRGYWTHIELRHAIKNGAKIKEVHSMLYADETCNPFISWVDTLYHERLRLKAAGDPRELVIKIMLNALYGKFGQRQEAGLQEIRSMEWWFANGQPDGVDFREIDDVVSVLVSKPSFGQPSYINTLWASYITSYARLTLLKYMLECDLNLYYCDTDSIFTTTKLDTSKELGAMKLEYENIELEIYGPKAYRMLKNGELIRAKAKGVPISNSDEYLTQGSTTFWRPIGLLEAHHRKHGKEGQIYYPSLWVEVTKAQHLNEPKRSLIPDSSVLPLRYQTRPHSLETLR